MKLVALFQHSRCEHSDGNVLFVNPEHVVSVERHSDSVTTLVFVNSYKINVQGDLEETVDKLLKDAEEPYSRPKKG